MRNKQVGFRRLPSDDYFLNTIGEHHGIDNTAVFRICLRDYAYRHGFAHPEFIEILLTMRNLVTGCRLQRVEGLEKTLAKAEKMLDRHKARLEKAYRFEEYPKDVEAEILKEEQEIRERAARKRKRW